ncbi:DDE-type integrase/transposase/recombinase [Enterovibrio coralii]|uniref:DDE-type integrase/transposase/recombinase n=1 Tax=Enterovibrio coralii TaxID=294935 RepID=UPI0009FB8B2D
METDVTEFRVKGQKAYLPLMISLFKRDVVTYIVEKHAVLPLLIGMLERGISTLNPKSKPIIHSGQGWQYRHRANRQWTNTKYVEKK